jgi:hypothetical protein
MKTTEMRKPKDTAIAEVFQPSAFYPPGSSPDDAPQGVVALTSEQAEHLLRKNWIPAEDFLKPVRESERVAELAAQQVEEARSRAEAELEAQKQANETAKKLQAQRDAEKIAAEARRQDTPAFFIAVALSAKRPLEERRSWINSKLVWLSQELGSVRGLWNDQASTYAREAIALHDELSTIRESIEAIDKQLNADIEVSAKQSRESLS